MVSGGWGYFIFFLNFDLVKGRSLCRVYTCRFDNQLPKRKVVKNYFLVVKLAQYFVCEVDRKLASHCKQEILGLNFRKVFSQTSGFVPGRQNR